jgi:HK97 family phage major capsid protein
VNAPTIRSEVTAVDTESLKREYMTLRDKALGITEAAIADGRSLTDQEATKVAELVDQAKAKHTEVEKATSRSGYGMPADEFDKLREQLDDAYGEGTKARGQGVREAHPWTKALAEADHLAGGHGEKAGVTGGGQGSVVVGSLADPAARLGTPGGELLALITVELWGLRGDGSSVGFLRQASRDLKAAVVDVGDAKPASDIGLDMVAADVWTFAHYLGAIPLAWLADAANLDTLIRSELAYGSQLAVEDALVNGPGPLPGAPLGILEDADVQQVPAGADAPLSILDGLTAVSSAGYSTGVVALNPSDWKAILAMKDDANRYQFGGSPFSGPGRTLWNAPVVLSNALAPGDCIVGDIGGAIRMVERQPVEVIVGTTGDELIHNQRTMVGEARLAFAVVRPQALAVVALT